LDKASSFIHLEVYTWAGLKTVGEAVKEYSISQTAMYILDNGLRMIKMVLVSSILLRMVSWSNSTQDILKIPSTVVSDATAIRIHII